MNKWSATLARTGHVFAIIRSIRAPLIVGLFTALLLSLPAQIRELYRVMVENLTYGTPYAYVQLSGTVIFFFVMLYGAWLTTIYVTKRHKVFTRAMQLPLSSIPLRILLLMPVVMILLGGAFGLSWAAFDLDAPGFTGKNISNDIERSKLILKSTSIFLILFAVAIIFLHLVSLRPHGNLVLNRSKNSIFVYSRHFITIVSLVLTATALIVLFPVAFPQLVGALFVLITFILALILATGYLTAIFDPFKIPVIAILISVAITLSISGANDNHEIEPNLSLQDNPHILQPISGVSSIAADESIFMEWLQAREDHKVYSKNGRPYPVFIIAASGGGMHAAAHAAIVLAKLQDRCPNFSQHVFAISGVSGGSLGAAVFAALAADPNLAKNEFHRDCVTSEGKSKHKNFERKAREFLRSDFLAPLIGGMVFRDLLQRFIPYPISSLDRARLMEDSFERAWAKLKDEDHNPFKAPYLDMWKPNGASPALLLNMTDVDNGLRVVVAPFISQHYFIGSQQTNAVKYTGLVNFYSYAGWTDGVQVLSDIKLSTAVSLSARFPWILPFGTIKRSSPLGVRSRADSESDDAYYVRLIDGGVFENSGAETAMDIIHQLSRYFNIAPEKERECARESEDLKTGRRQKISEICSNFLKSKKILVEAGFPHGVKFHLLLIDAYTDIRREAWYSRSELFSPIAALMSTREARGQLANFRAMTLGVPCWDESGEWTQCEPWSVQMSILDSYYYPLPLGWHISQRTIDLIANHSGDADQSDLPGKPIWLPARPDGRWDHVEEQHEENLASYKEHAMVPHRAACAVQLILRGDNYADWKSRGHPDLRPCR